MAVPLTATTGRNGSQVVFSSALVHGFMAETTSEDMSTIVFIPNTVIADQRRNVERKRSLHGASIKLPTLKATKFGMDAATQVGESTKINRAR